MKSRTLEREELDLLWSIDRSERVDRVYRFENGRLVLVPERHDTRGWPPGEPERDGALIRDCFDHGGTVYGVFEGATLVGAAVLESRFIGRAGDQLQLKFLHVGRRHRGAGVGHMLFDQVVARARELGARKLYVSATPSENTIRFYLGRGCRVAEEVDAALFALEPEDIHLEYEIPR
ncbi:MAG: GNAT family N-acetyltransferase [Myxococcota bacterium]